MLVTCMQSVPFYDVAIRLPTIFNKMRDVHVTVLANSRTVDDTAQAIVNMPLGGSYLFLFDPSSGRVAAEILNLDDLEKPVLQYNGFLLESIDGMSLLEWVSDLVSGETWPWQANLQKVCVQLRASCQCWHFLELSAIESCKN